MASLDIKQQKLAVYILVFVHAIGKFVNSVATES